MIIIFDQDGDGRMIYSDEGAEVASEIGETTITRASHVEPIAGGWWVANMSPVGGPNLGAFRTRGEALAAEHEWLIDNAIPIPRRDQ
jgi:hypothetical protein